MKQHFDLEYSIRTSLYLLTPTFPLKPHLNEGNTREELLLLLGHTDEQFKPRSEADALPI